MGAMYEPLLVLPLYLGGAAPVAMAGAALLWRRSWRDMDGISMYRMIGVWWPAMLAGSFTVSWLDGALDLEWFLIISLFSLIGSLPFLGLVGLGRRRRRLTRTRTHRE